MSNVNINKSFSAADAIHVLAVNDIETKDEIFQGNALTGLQYSKTAKEEASNKHDDQVKAAQTQFGADITNASASVAGGVVDLGGSGVMKKADPRKMGSETAKKRIGELDGEIDALKAKQENLGQKQVDAGDAGDLKPLSEATPDDVQRWETKRDNLQAELDNADASDMAPEQREFLQSEIDGLNGDIDAYEQYQQVGQQVAAREAELDRVIGEELKNLTSTLEIKVRGLSQVTRGLLQGAAAFQSQTASLQQVNASKHETEKEWAEGRSNAMTSLSNKAASSKDTIVNMIEEVRQKQAAIISRVAQQV
ncbi:hypothetical protein [Roseiconus lacunae]|uniref:hypothetical protein n=1 Tax=Roseiconus lacunae TaxID=2605694 RepID=UPI001E4E3FE2|nr:hypothetical protein [Roseiconus lacunae]MCD0457897.1 hypothetical protein [Roseiconus lacunae]